MDIIVLYGKGIRIRVSTRFILMVITIVMTTM